MRTTDRRGVPRWRGLATLVVATVGLATAAPASAAPNEYAPSIGTVTGAGAGPFTTNASFNVKGSVSCPAGDTVVNAYIDNPAAGWTQGQVLAISANNTDVPNLTSTGIPLTDSLLNLAASAGKALANGSYQFSLVCLPDVFSTANAQLDGTFTVTGSTVAWTTAGVPTATTTTVAASPVSPQVVGTRVTFTASVSPAGAGGSVQFTDTAGGSTTNLGAPVTVAGGVASLSTSSLAVGGHSVKAVFTPSDASAFAASTSSALAYTISPSVTPPTATTTTVAASPVSPQVVGTRVTFTASVSPAGAGGSVQFTDTFGGSTTSLGAPVAVAGGVASLSTSSLAVGGHSVKAVFTPSDASAFAASTSSALAYTISPSVTPPTATTTTVAASPVSPQVVGTRVTFTASVSPAGAGGSVQFTDTFGGSTTNLGAPVTVAGGVASLSTSSLAVGGHSVKAVFTPSDASAFAASTSSALAYTISPSVTPPTATRTRLYVTRDGRWGCEDTKADHREDGERGHEHPGLGVLLFAVIHPHASAGSVQFTDTVNGQAKNVGAPVTVRHGIAVLRLRPVTVGLHVYQAVFVPKDPTAYLGSSSPKVRFVVRAHHS